MDEPAPSLPIRLLRDAAIALGAVAAGTLIRLALVPLLGHQVPFITYFPAVLVAALLGGWTGGLIALALSTAAAWAIFINREQPVVVTTLPGEAARVATFLVSGACVVAVAAAYRGTTGRAREAEHLAHRRLGELRDIYAAAPAGLAFLDEGLRFVKINEVLAAAFGPPAAAHVGRTLREMVEPALADAIEPLLRRALGGEVVADREVRARDPRSGAPAAWLWNAAPVRVGGPTGRVVGVQVVAHDITARTGVQEALRASEEEYRALFELGAAARLEFDPVTRRFLRVNAAYCALTGRSEAELMALEDPFVVVHPEDRERVRGDSLPLMEGRADHYRTEMRLLRPRGDTVWVLTEARLLPPVRGPVRLIADLVDITDQKRAEAELLRRAADLARSNEELESFAYAASHDLKEPLRGIANYARFLEEDHGAHLPAAGLEQLKTIRRLSMRLSDLLDAMMEYSRAGRGELVPEPVPSAALVSRAVQSVESWLAARGARVAVAPDLPEVLGDPARLEQVFRNLIVNAVKYNESREKLVEVAFEGGAFAVRDNGIGIDPRHHERIFEIFRRLHPRDRFEGGSGVGLALVRRIVERHGGRVWVRSAPGEGATFLFTLPVAAGHAGRPARPAPASLT